MCSENSPLNLTEVRKICCISEFVQNYEVIVGRIVKKIRNKTGANKYGLYGKNIFLFHRKNVPFHEQYKNIDAQQEFYEFT